MQRRRPPQNQSAPEELVAQLRLDELKLFNLVAKLGSFSAAPQAAGSAVWRRVSTCACSSEK
ncbi:hypothetical protein L4D76_18370 [Photobacterium sagamiensis]|uniref:helix-turn-helix domain-containing protein n=1 Tax=Photobacterium sagamiensis TaxID=2910241 RepID=UPI003D134D90